MKKFYSAPDAKVYIIETAQMIAESFGKDSTSSVDPSGTNVLSRDGGDWGDED